MRSKVCYLIDDDPDEVEFFEVALSELNTSLPLAYASDLAKALKALGSGEIRSDYIFRRY